MIVFGAIVPHSPLLIPSIGKEHREKLTNTLKAYAELEQAIYLAQPETLLIVSPHAQMYSNSFSGNAAPKYTGVLKEFGDHGTTIQAKADFLLLDHIHRAMRSADIPFTLTTEEELDYGLTIPLLLLTSHLANWKLVPLAISLLDPRAHFEFGRHLKSVIHAETTRVAIIASADLSHHANAMSSEGATAEGSTFDEAIRQKALAMDAAGLLALNSNIIEKSDQCGYKPILTLLGALENMNCIPKELCYEAPFGVGYMTAKFEIA